MPLIARIKILAGMDIAEKRRPQDGRILIKVSGKKMDMRVSTLPSIFGEKAVLRLLDQDNERIGIEKLGFEHDQAEKTETGDNSSPWNYPGHRSHGKRKINDPLFTP